MAGKKEGEKETINIKRFFLYKVVFNVQKGIPIIK